jgi:hypothetical protein
MTDASVPTPSVARKVRLWITVAFVIGVLVQVYLAGRGVFGASSYKGHEDFGYTLHGISVLVLAASFFGADMRNRTDIGLAVVLVILTTVQTMIASYDHPDVSAFHPVNALLIMGCAGGIVSRDRRLSAGPPSPAPAA